MQLADANRAIEEIKQQLESVEKLLTIRGQMVCSLEIGVSSIYERLVGVK
jgi:hypothetical protein